eukprot:Hpha_TRINITY_DN19213_c0_g1::TRINITY_DN19213_c0_g1_i1::g.194381::m.194381
MGTCGGKIVAGRRVGGSSVDWGSDDQSRSACTSDVHGFGGSDGGRKGYGKGKTYSRYRDDDTVDSALEDQEGERVSDWDEEGGELVKPVEEEETQPKPPAKQPSAQVLEIISLPFDVALDRYPKWSSVCACLPRGRYESLKSAWEQGDQRAVRAVERSLAKGDFEGGPKGHLGGAKKKEPDSARKKGSVRFNVEDKKGKKAQPPPPARAADVNSDIPSVIESTDSERVAELASVDWRTGSTVDTASCPSYMGGHGLKGARSPPRPDEYAVGASWDPSAASPSHSYDVTTQDSEDRYRENWR